MPPRLLPQIRFPGAYRCVCVELRITHLAVNCFSLNNLGPTVEATAG